MAHGLTAEDRAKGLEARRAKEVLPRLRSEWLNLHLGGYHWIHNDLTDWNLKAIHSCPVCREFRKRHWPRHATTGDF
jgi:hypothetical protein